MDLSQAIVYDIESLPNVFTLNFVGLHSDIEATFEISQFRDDRVYLFKWFDYWQANQTPMIGFNSLAYDFPLLHYIRSDPYCSEWDIYNQSQAIISGGRFGSVVWQDDRFAPQIDLLKIHHLDNPAKRTSLKALEVNMRLDNVLEMPLPFDQPLTAEQIETVLVPYNKYDVRATKQFALYSMPAIEFRLGISETLQGDVLNWSDTKIGGKLLEARLGDDLCYTRDSGRREPRQTPRDRIPLADIIFPYVAFRSPPLQQVLDWLKGQTLVPDELTETLRTKGVLTGLVATVAGFDFHFGTGGIHGSVSSRRVEATPDRAIVDIDVASLYPSIAIVNRLYPEHLGERFADEYARLPAERKEWQAKKGKKCTEANSLKLAANGTYGNSNNRYSVFYDPKFTMTITVNGQLMLAMLAERLLTVPTLQILMVNTDGITFTVHPDLLSYTRRLYHDWEKLTKLNLEEALFTRIFIRDVNNYVAEYEE